MVWDQISNAAKASSASGVKPVLTGTYSANGWECRPSFQLLVDLAKEYPPQKASEITGIKAELIIKLAEKMVSDRPVSIMTHMGFTRTFYGDLSMRAVGTLAAVTGNINLASGSGHRPVVLNWGAFLHPDRSKPTFSRIGVLQLYDAAISGKPFPIKAVWFAFINFLNQCANSNKIAKEVFPSLDFIVSADLFMTPTSRYCDIILPACTFLEFSDLVLGPYPYLQLHQKVIEPLHEAKSDVTIVNELAQRLGFGQYFAKDEEGLIDLLLDSGHPSVEGINVKGLKKGPMPTHSTQFGPARSRGEVFHSFRKDRALFGSLG